MIGTVINGLSSFWRSLIAVYTVDKSGRKPALKSVCRHGSPMVVMGLAWLSLNGGNPAPWVCYLSAIMTMIFIAGFAMSAGPIVWVLCSEIQPLKMREFGVACSTMTNWITCAVVGATFLSLIDALGSSMTFWMYAGLNAVFIALTFAFVPENEECFAGTD